MRGKVPKCKSVSDKKICELFEKVVGILRQNTEDINENKRKQDILHKMLISLQEQILVLEAKLKVMESK